MLTPSGEDIVEFWEWFVSIEAELANDFDNMRLQSELDDRVGNLGDIAWELGPGTTTDNALVISPDGNPDLLPLTEYIVSLAPDRVGWEFLSARPARDGGVEFSIMTGTGEELAVDARTWRYVLFKAPGGKFDIVLEQANLARADEDDRYAAAIIAIDGLLGERRRLALIRDVDPVLALSLKQGRKANLVTVLPAHLGSLAP